MAHIKKFIHENRTPLLGAILHWLITTVLQIDRAFFSYDTITIHCIIVKFLYFVFLITAWVFVKNAFVQLKAGNPEYRRGLQFFAVYCAILMAFLLVLWPGTWLWDDINIIYTDRHFTSFMPWQHILSGIYTDVLLEVLPFPGGIIFLQNVLAALCAAFSVTALETCFHIRKLKHFLPDALLKLLPFLLPPVLMYQFSGYRIGIYLYLELVLLTELICVTKSSREWSWFRVAGFACLSVLVASWRTESLFYIPVLCLLFCFIRRDVLPALKKAVCILLLIIGFLGVNRWQSYELGSKNYQILSIMCPCVELVRAADPVTDAEALENIDRVTDVDVILNNPLASGDQLFWEETCLKYDYSGEDYRNYLKAFLRLSLRYPGVVFAERWDEFVRAAGIAGETFLNEESANLFNGREGAAIELFTRQGWLFTEPLFKNIRRAAIHILCAKGIDGELLGNGILRRIIWNAAVPLLILVCAWLRLLVEKKWFLWLLCSAVIVRIPLVFLTEPSNWFMYWLPFYFLGYVYLLYRSLIYFTEKGMKNG